jgi:hypothetical protein
MRFGRFANLLIMFAVAAGLLLAPLAAPVMAASMAPNAAPHDMSIAHEMSMADEMSTADEMPCCPGDTKNKTCDSCPFVALCMLGISLPAPSGAATLVERTPLRAAFAAMDDQRVDGLGAKPPDHPPRMMI